MKRLEVLHICKNTFVRSAVFAVVMAIALVAYVTPLIHAQQPAAGLNLAVSPSPLVIQAKPGKTTTAELKVKNANLTTEHVKISLMKFGAEGEDGTPKLEDIGPNDIFASWIKFSQDRFDAETEVWKTITVTLNPPADAAFGYYYGIVFSRDTGDPQTPTGRSSLQGAAAVLALVDVPAPGAKREAKLTEFSLAKKSYEFLPTDFTIRLQNTGNTHSAPRGNIFITKGGKNVGLLEVNKEGGFILPNTGRKFTAGWQDGSPVYKLVEADGKAVLDKNGKQKSALDWSNFSPSKVRFGKYTAHLTMVYNDGTSDIPVDGEVSFWVIPWRILGVLLVVTLLLLAGLYTAVIRPLKNRLKKKQQ